MKNFALFLALFTFQIGNSQHQHHLQAIREFGKMPLDFVQEVVDTHDLILFDDGLHSAYEPFQFYNDLIADLSPASFDFIFIEVFAINTQPYIDAYLEGDDKDETLLYTVFQNDFSGFGWRYQTYVDLLNTVWDYNHRLNATHQIEVVAVDQPIYWEGIHNRQEYDLYLKSHIGRDYFMYRTILKKMQGFQAGKKGIFLSNTRHVYKHIKKVDGTLFWNTGTFFTQWHPGKTYSIRFHNAALYIESVKIAGSKSAQGLEEINYRWGSMDNGLWDEAWHEFGNEPVAIPLKGNVFGRTPYVGNHMLQAQPGQTMYDAHDAIIFLAPLDQLHFSATVNFYFTDSFKKELERRLNILYADELPQFLERNNCKSTAEFIKQLAMKQPIEKNRLIRE